MTSIDSRRERVAKNWGLTDEIVIIRSGSLVPIDGTDMHYPYQPHPNFAYLAAVGVPDAVLTYDAQQNHWETFSFAYLYRVPEKQDGKIISTGDYFDATGMMMAVAPDQE